MKHQQADKRKLHIEKLTLILGRNCPDFACYFRVKATKSDNRDRFKEIFHVEFESPLKIQNCLPVSLYFRALSRSSQYLSTRKKTLTITPIDGGKIDSGKDIELFYHPYNLRRNSREEDDLKSKNSNDLLISISPANASWSEAWQPFSMFPPPKFVGSDALAVDNEMIMRGKRHTVRVSCKDYETLQIILESSRSALGAVTTTAYVETWLLNLTGLFLNYRLAGEYTMNEIGYGGSRIKATDNVCNRR